MSLTFREYQFRAIETAIYPRVVVNPDSVGESSQRGNYIYPALGLAGESGEILEKVKKLVRDKDGFFDERDKEAIGKECGDLIWYISALCNEFNLDLGDVAQSNLEKLAARKAKGTLQGSGDDR